jgi:hypothetical protein
VTASELPDDLLADRSWDAAQRFVQRVSDSAALNAAAEWVTRADPRAREAGFAVLALLALDDEDARRTLLEAAEAGSGDLDCGVRISVAAAIGNLSDCAEARDVLLTMVADADADVVAQVIGGFPITAPEPTIADPWVQCVMVLLRDKRPLVQDWAAFALGTLTDVDSDDLRDDLLRIAETDADDDDIYPAAEAAMGLARRKDARVEAIIEDHLADSGVSSLWLEAAAELAEPRLHPALVKLRDQVHLSPATTWDDSLARALESCSRPAGRT